MQVWDLSDCTCIATLEAHRDPIRQLAVSGDTLFSAGAKTVRVWRLADLSCAGVLQVCDVRGSARAIALATSVTCGAAEGQKESGTELYVGGQDCQVKMYGLGAGGAQGMAAKVGEDGLQPDSPRLMHDHQTVRGCVGCAAEACAVTGPASGHLSTVTALAVGGSYIFSGSSDSTVRVWELGTLRHVRTLRGHRGSVLALLAAPGLLLSGGRDDLIRVWDSDTLVCRRTLRCARMVGVCVCVGGGGI